METASHSFFRISSLMQARDLQKPLGTHFDKEHNAHEAIEELFHDDPSGRAVSLVFDGTEIIGFWATATDLDVEELQSRSLADLYHPISITSLISSSCTFFDIADCFARHPGKHLYFVIDGTEITGTISYDELFGRMSQLCILSLVFGLETAAEEVCLLTPETCWKALTMNRKQLASQVCERRFEHLAGSPLDSNLHCRLRCTTFIDKSTMLSRVLTGSVDKTMLKRLFGRAERVRNLCAHGAAPDEFWKTLPRQKFADFLHGMQNLVESLQVVLKRAENGHQGHSHDSSSASDASE